MIMKKILLQLAVVVFVFAGTVTAHAQERRRVTFGGADTEDMIEALKMLNMHIVSVDLPVDENESFKVSILLEEYAYDTLVAKIPDNRLRPTMEKIRYEGDDEYTMQTFDRLVFTINALDEKRSSLRCAGGGASVGMPLKLRRVSEIRRIDYLLRLFKPQEFVPGAEIPVFMYASPWYDEKYGIYRFCGSGELDPEMDDELLVLSPHYYILKIVLTPNPDFETDLNED